MRLTTIPVIAFCLLVGSQVLVAAGSTDPCSLPADLQHEISAKYPGATVVGLSDLEKDDRVFFEKDHDDACPGLVKVDFYGDGRQTLALVLNRKNGAQEHTELVVAHHVGDQWKIAEVSTGGASPYAPVVWSQPPGQYKDIEGEKTVRATRPVIVFSKYESWAILYAWTGGRISKIWLQD